MVELTFQDSEARGRNGWFRMAAASLHEDRGRVHVNIVSKRAVIPGPVYLELSSRDALVLAGALIHCAK